MQKFYFLRTTRMKKNLYSVFFAFLCLFFVGCSNSKHVAYFQNADVVSYEESKGLFDARIMPKDLLTITVSATDPKAVTPFNLSVSNALNSTGTLGGGGSSLQTYLVDNDGFINFPVVGSLKVGGLTKRECENLVRDKIKPYMAESENPIVTVKMASFKVTVSGEVKSPGVFIVDQEKINVIEALARAGDLTIYGRRDNVLLIREDATGQKSVIRLNLNDANLINSPYYYLQQNDCLYVEPNKTQANNSSIGSSTTIWLSVVGILTSVASLLVNVLRD